MGVSLERSRLNDNHYPGAAKQRNHAGAVRERSQGLSLRNPWIDSMTSRIPEGCEKDRQLDKIVSHPSGMRTRHTDAIQGFRRLNPWLRSRDRSAVIALLRSARVVVQFQTEPLPVFLSGVQVATHPLKSEVRRVKQHQAIYTMADRDAIVVRGARVNNLKNINFEIPLNSLTVVTGVSGSGKSSLAFDTVYAEGQRRYVESLSAYARQFLERMDKPDVDEVIGICPAIAINQKNSSRNPRSTVGTQTEIYDYLRLLYARVGVTQCRRCGGEVRRDTPQSIADEVMQIEEGTRFYVLFPAAAGMAATRAEQNGQPTREKRERKAQGKSGSSPTRAGNRSGASIKAHVMSLMQRGLQRLFVSTSGEVIELQTPEDFTRPSLDDVFVLVDRLTVRSEMRSRLVDSLETCYREGHGEAVILTTGEKPRRLVFAERFECKNCGLGYVQPEPRLFSFNNPFGACPTCQGFGNTIGLDWDLVIPDRELSLGDGAIEPFTKPQFEWWRTELKKFARREGIPFSTPFGELSRAQQRAIIEGEDGFHGVKGFFDWLETKKYKLHVRVFLAKYRGYTRCPECDGQRLRSEARDVRVGGKSLPEICQLSIKNAAQFFETLELGEEQASIAERLLKEIRERLQFLINVGLDYLTLERLASTLSGGEAQRIQLATHLGSSLVGALYVLDEPSIGLHARDSQRLIHLLQNLRDIGNTVLVVEHEAEMMRAADHILDVGLGAGELGGEIVFEGSLDGLMESDASLTAKYLRREQQIKRTAELRLPGKQAIEIRGLRQHNLKEYRRPDSARTAGMYHRRFRFGQVDTCSRLRLCRSEKPARRLARARLANSRA